MQHDSVSLSFSIRRGECHLAVHPDRNPPTVGGVYPEELPARLTVLREVLRGDVERTG